MARAFPMVCWGAQTVTFVTADPSSPNDDHPPAALVFAFHGDRIVLADIRGRGWCIPGGRLNAGECAVDAARREAWEEAGVTLGTLRKLGATMEVSADGSMQILAVSYVASTEGFSPIPETSESSGIRLARRDELATLYYRWDALMEAMFVNAWEQQGESLQSSSRT